VEPLLAIVRAGRATQSKHEEALALAEAKTTVANVGPSNAAPSSFVRKDDSQFVFLFQPICVCVSVVLWLSVIFAAGRQCQLWLWCLCWR
jgi:hypothetical protein